MDITALVEMAKALKDIKAAGLTIDDLKEAKTLLSPSKARLPSVNGADKKLDLHMTRTDDDLIEFKAKGYKTRKVSLDDLRAGLVAVEQEKFISENKKTGTKFVVRASTEGREKEKVLGENLILAAKNANFI